MQKVLSQKIKRHRFLLRKTEPHLTTRISPLKYGVSARMVYKTRSVSVTFTVYVFSGILVSHISGGGAGKQELKKCSLAVDKVPLHV